MIPKFTELGTLIPNRASTLHMNVVYIDLHARFGLKLCLDLTNNDLIYSRFHNSWVSRDAHEAGVPQGTRTDKLSNKFKVRSIGGWECWGVKVTIKGAALWTNK